MWNTFVSIGNSIVSRLIVAFVDMFWRHPIVGAALLLVFAGLTASFCLELFRDERGSRKADSNPEEMVIRLKRTQSR